MKKIAFIPTKENKLKTTLLDFFDMAGWKVVPLVGFESIFEPFHRKELRGFKIWICGGCRDKISKTLMRMVGRRGSNKPYKLFSRKRIPRRQKERALPNLLWTFRRRGSFGWIIPCC